MQGSQYQEAIDAAWENRSLLAEPDTLAAVHGVLALLDSGDLRVASPPDTPGNSWVVHSWIKRAILLYFGIAEMETSQVGPFEYRDKIPLKTDYETAGVRVVPPATVRYGAHVEPGAILMPSYVNIGARVGSGTMVDTWATVGSCAQIGKDVHLSGGVGIGGVLEPPSASPVIVEDGAFIGSRCIVVEGVHVGSEAVIGAGVVLTASTQIIDTTGSFAPISAYWGPVPQRGKVPPRAVVIPGSVPKEFAGGTYHVPAALIIGERTESTDRKTSLNSALRDFAVSV